MHAFNVIATLLVVIPSVFAQSTRKAAAPDLFNGWYNIVSVGDNRTLSLESGDGVFVLSDPTTRNSTWYINSAPSGDAIIASTRRGGVLTGVNRRDDANPYNSQVQGQDVATTDEGRRRQDWRLVKYDDGTYEIINSALDQLLDVLGGVGRGPEVIMWSRNIPVTGNQRWRISEFRLTS